MADQIYLPVGAALVRTNTLVGTDSMIGWMRDITKWLPGPSSGGAAPANAFYVVSAPNGSLTNARVATSTATVTVDTSVANIIKWNAPGANLHTGPTVAITNAQFKALPTTSISVLVAPGANIQIGAFWLVCVSDFTAGAYTNVNADGYLTAAYGGTGEIGNYIANDSTIPLTFLNDLTAATASTVLLQQYTYAEPVDLWGNLAEVEGTVTNTAIHLKVNNNGAGNFTGGNAANTLHVTPFWIQVAV